MISGKTRKKLHCSFPADVAAFLHHFAAFLQQLQLSSPKLQFSCKLVQESCKLVQENCRLVQESCNICRKTAMLLFRVLPEIAFVAVALHLEMSEASALTRCHQITG